jgi:hypothetical protein
MIVLDYQTVEKEVVPSLLFKKAMSVKQHPELRQQIEKATLLGNGYRTKVSIYFYDDESLKRVETTIWVAGEKYICLKGGIWIPIARIVEIKY